MIGKNARYQIIAIALLGSLVRIVFGFIYAPWNQAPDQIAQEVLIQDGTWTYDQFIHYPHEGGSIVMSFLGHLVKLFTNFNSLTIVAILFDFGSRWVQLFVAHKIVDRKLFYAFGLWTIFATPTILYYGTLNYGLHALSSFFPFVMLYLLWLNKDSVKHNVLLGLFLGISIWFSYSNVVLIFPYLIFQFAQKKSFRSWIYSLGSFAAVIGLHLLVRMYVDAGFGMVHQNLDSIRGTAFLWDDPETWRRLYKVWMNPLVDSSIALINSPYTFYWIKYVWIALFFLGVAGLIKTYLKDDKTKILFLNSSTILFFILIYAVSPFYYDRPNFGHAVYYRHLTYIFPFLAFFVIVGLAAWRAKKITICLFLLISIYSTSLSFMQEPSSVTAEKAAGWVLGQKFGDDPVRIHELIAHSSYDKVELTQGAAWGMTLALFHDVFLEDTEALNSRTEELRLWLDMFPQESQPDLIEGVKFAFNPDVTPKLDPTIFPLVLAEIQRQ